MYQESLGGIAMNYLLLPSALLLIVFTLLISLIYYLSDIKLWNATVIIALYGLFLWLVIWIANHPEIADGIMGL